MKKLVLIACCLLICLMATSAEAANTFVVESRGFNVSQTACTLGCWLSNDVAIQGLTIPLELRSLTGGAYTASNITGTNLFNLQAGRRVDHSPLSVAYDNFADSAWPAASITRGAFDVAAVNSCSGPTSNTFATAANNFVPSSPDAVFFAAVSQGDPSFELINLSPGADGAARSQASFRILFNANASIGCFEIDTCCRTPANHLAAVDENVAEVLFDFTKGVVSLGGANCSGPPPNTKPNAICQNLQVAADGNCQGSATAAQVNNGSSDTEDGTNLILALTPAGPYALGANPVSLIVTDQGGLADTCPATITVVDQTAPVIGCPSDIAVQCPADIPAAHANAAAFVAAGGTVTDNCPNPTVSLLDQVSDGNTCPNVITRRYVATDGAGNKDTCTQLVTVDDTQSPVITDCPNDTVINLPNGQTSTQVLYSDASITDNCNNVNIIHSPLSNSTFNVGTTQVRLIASDLCGNADTCFFNVTINELPAVNTPPTAICKNVDANATSTCNASVSASQVDNGSNDPEDLLNVTLALNPAGPYPLGQTQVWLVVTDQGGLKDSCQATITVSDVTAPSISCPPSSTFSCTNAVPAPYATLAAFIGAGGSASDFCDQTLTFALNNTIVSGSPNCNYDITRTYRVTDDAGNFDECDEVIHVNDSIPPVVTCAQGDTTVIVPSGTPNVAVAFGTGTATDNCDVSVSVVCSPPSGALFPVGVTPVMCIATDDCGNKDTCTFTITVREEVPDAPPVALCSDVKVFADGDCQGNALISNGSFDPDGGSVTLSQNPAGPYNLGLTLVLLTVTDDEGDTDTCSAWVTVNDVTPPTAVCPDDIKVPNDLGQCGAIVNWSNNLGPEDNCGPVNGVFNPASGSFFQVGTTQVEHIVTDNSGNADTCYFNVTVNDVERPTVQCSNVKFSNDPEECGRLVYAADLLPSITYGDNCGVTFVQFQVQIVKSAPAEKLSQGVVFIPVGTFDAWVNVYDQAGNASDTCKFTITINDTEKPTIICNTNIIVDAPFGANGTNVNFSTDASDNCPGVQYTCSAASGDFFPIGTTTVCCWAYDAAQNWDSCCFTITVNPGSPTAPGPHVDVDTLLFKVRCGCDTQSVDVYCVQPPNKGDDPNECFYNIVTDVPGIHAAPNPGMGPRKVDIVACRSDLLPDSYEGWVYFYNAPGQRADSIYVIFEVNEDTPGLDVKQDTLRFTYTGDIFNDKLCLPIDINTTGCSENCWGLVGGSGDWVWVDPTSGETPGQTEICVTPCAFQAGVYYHTLHFCPCEKSGPPEPNGCDSLVVKLTVVNPPVLVVDPQEIHIEIDCEKKALPVPVYVTNGGGGRLDWNAWTNANWFTFEPTDGTAPDTFYVSIIPDSIPCPNVCDTLIDSICVYGNKGCALNSPQWVTVELVICPPDTSICDSICGYVYDCLCDFKSTCGLDGATVELWSSYPDGEIIEVDTADWGRFCFDVEPGVEYDLRFWKKGYCTDTVSNWSCEDGALYFCLDRLDFVLPESPIFHDYYSTNATFEGYLILPGDVIYACDSNGIIVGLAYVDAPGTYLIHVLGNVPKDVDTLDEGADPGEKVSLWLNCKCPVIVNEGFQNFGNTLFDAAWDCRPTGICCELCEGWNMFSYNVYLNDYSRTNVLATIDLNYDAVRSGRCAVDGPNPVISWFAGRPVNDLTEVEPWYGYDIHMTAADTLCLEGAIIPADTEIPLCEGWNYIPYYPLEADSRVHALASIAGHYTNIYNLWCDEFDSYNVTRPEGANDLFCLYPCRGYWIKMSVADTLVYPTDGYDCNEPIAKVVPSYNSGQVKGSPVSADFWSATDASSSGLRSGDIITVLTESGLLVGEAQVGEHGMFLLHVFGDVSQTATVEGAQPGERLTFQVNGYAASVEGNVSFNERESSQITVRASGANPVPNDYALLQNYPNPFNAGTVIPFTMKDASEWTLTVYNIMGQTVQSFAGFDAPGTVRVSWNGLDQNGGTVPSGVYFYRVTTASWSATKKMTLLK